MTLSSRPASTSSSGAYVRDIRLMVPADCVAAPVTQDHEHALGHMQRVVDVDVTLSDELDLQEVARRKGGD